MKVNEPGRNKKTVYFCKHTKVIGKASSFPHWPHARKHRYILIGYFFKVPRLEHDHVKRVLLHNGINYKRLLELEARKKKDLPF